MRLRGLVFEHFGSFSRAEASLCDERGTPLEVALFVGDAGAGKSTLLRGIAGLLAEASGREGEFSTSDIRFGADQARCRIVFDDIAESALVKVTLERVVSRSKQPADIRGMTPEAFAIWKRALLRDTRPRAAISLAGSFELTGEVSGAEAGHAPSGLSQLAWVRSIQGRPEWERVVQALDRILWPYRLVHVTADQTLVFDGPERFVPLEQLGDSALAAFVMTVDLLRLTTARPEETMVYVIDDIDAHLDPRGQARILGELRKLFPKIQILATTRSPFLCASVEPRHVFRIQRSEQGRMLSRVGDAVVRSRAVSSVMDLAFGAPELAGPRWVHNPSAEVRAEVMRALEPSLARSAVVYALPEVVDSTHVRDSFGDVPFTALPKGRGHVFFVDADPGQPWGHACEYVFRTTDGVLFRQPSTWPPPELVERYVTIGYG